jgi:hypothetical protein
MELQLILASLASILFGGAAGFAVAKRYASASDTAGAVNSLKAAVARVKAAKAKVDSEQGALLAQVPEIVKGL